MKTRIYYSVENGGDGSAYPIFMESYEQAELHQDNMDEGWGEPCTGSLEISSEGPIRIRRIQTIQDSIDDLEEQINEDKECYPNNDYPDQRARWEKHLKGLEKLKLKKNKK